MPITAISGRNEPLYLRAGIGLGAAAALKKPLAADELPAFVERLLDG